MRISYFILPVILLISFILFGCSGGSSSPVAPDDSLSVSMPEQSPVFVSDWDSEGNPTAGQGVLGFFELNVNPDEVNAELTPLRSTAITDTLEIIDITNFMQIFPCTTCVLINSVGINGDGNLVVNMGVKHPFDVGDPSQPVTGKNRADLHVFNVEGIVVSNLNGDIFGGLSEMTPGFTLVNAHGYTDYLDAALEDVLLTFATVHPYITHFTDYSTGNFAPTNPTGFASVVNPKPSGFNVMPMGSGYSNKDYIFEIDGPMNFILAIGCTYAITTNTFEDRFTPEYRCPQHNKKAASKVTVSITNNDLQDGNTTSTAQLNIEVVDINHGVSVGDGLDQMFADSSVDEILVDIPGVLSDVLTIDGGSSTGGTGHSPSDPLTYVDTITNSEGASMGTYPGLVKVIDAYPTGSNTNPFIETNDGGERVPPGTSPLTGLFEIDEFVTYQVFSVDVGQSMIPPVASLSADPLVIVNPPGTVTLDGTASSDTDGSITQYEFDFDWDGNEANFSADETNTTGTATTPSLDTPTTFTMGLRVTDNDTLVDYTSVDVKVNAAPTAGLAKDPDVPTLEQYDILMLLNSGSSDPDGSIVLYEYDFDWDGVPGNFNADDSTTSSAFPYRLVDAGTFTIGLRVTDNDGAMDYDSVDIEVTPRSAIFVDVNNRLGPWEGTWDNPYQYIQDGVDNATDGDTVWVLSGVYDEDPGGAPTSPDAEITIADIPNLTLYGEDLPTISLHEYTGASPISGISATNCPNLNIDGFSFLISPSYFAAIELNNCSSAEVENCWLTPGSMGVNGFLWADNCDSLTVWNNNLFEVFIDLIAENPALIYVQNSTGATISLNEISGFRFNTVASNGLDYSMITTDTSPNSVISKNKIYNMNLTTEATDLSLYGINTALSSDSSRIRNNLIYGVTLASINPTEGHNLDVIAAYDSISVEIYNNTVDAINGAIGTHNIRGCYIVDLTTPDVYNNILTNINGDKAYGVSRTGGDAVTVDYCDVWSITGASTSARFDNVTEGGNGLDADPIYMGAPLGDYHLSPLSPCVGAGRDNEDMGAYGGVDPLP